MLGSSPFEGVDTPPKGLRNQPASSSGDWVRVASALFIHGFDVGRDLQMSWLGDEVKAALEASCAGKESSSWTMSTVSSSMRSRVNPCDWL